MASEGMTNTWIRVTCDTCQGAFVVRQGQTVVHRDHAEAHCGLSCTIHLIIATEEAPTDAPM